MLKVLKASAQKSMFSALAEVLCHSGAGIEASFALDLVPQGRYSRVVRGQAATCIETDRTGKLGEYMEAIELMSPNHCLYTVATGERSEVSGYLVLHNDDSGATIACFALAWVDPR